MVRQRQNDRPSSRRGTHDLGLPVSKDLASGIFVLCLKVLKWKTISLTSSASQGGSIDATYQVVFGSPVVAVNHDVDILDDVLSKSARRQEVLDHFGRNILLT